VAQRNPRRKPARLRPKLRGSLRSKFIRTMLLVSSIIGVVTLATSFTLGTSASERHLLELERGIEEGIVSKGKSQAANHSLALRSMIVDRAYGDMQTLLVHGVSQDPDMVYGLFVGADGEVLAFHERGRPSEPAAPNKDAWQILGIGRAELITKYETVRRAQRLGEQVVEIAQPVFGERGEMMGVLRYGLSARRLQQSLSLAAAASNAERLRAMAVIVLTVGIATGLGILLSRRHAARITQPVQALSQAALLAVGQRSVRVTITSGDELEVLGSSFNRMMDELARSYGELEHMNENLEQKVADRTLALAGRNRDMRLVLDNIDQGFLTLSLKGVMASERSAVVDRWFGPMEGKQTFWSYLAATSPDFARSFELAWEQLVDDALPYEVAIEQLPSRLTTDAGATFSFRYLPFLNNEQLEGVLVVAFDITDRLLHEREEAELMELMHAFRRLTVDRRGFLAFMSEASSMVARIVDEAEQEPGTLRSTLHTLKGNAGQMGLTVIARLCHDLEDELASGDGMKSQAQLGERWKALAEHVLQLIGDRKRRTLEVDGDDYDALVALLSREGNRLALRELLTWQLEPVARALARLAEQAQGLARRLDKGIIEVDVQAGSIRLDAERFAPFFADLTHLVRNAVDHGLEHPAERAALGKPPHGKMVFKAQVRGDQLTFEISDDGTGIDWESIAARGTALGLPSQTAADRLAILCHEGVTTRSEVSEISGRGVGMFAFRQRIEALHGRLEVESTLGLGTKWLISLPWSPEEAPEHLRREALRAAS
jgi:HPt (histidine-containing phosphotransfer) domain-containing protein/HAMP domain-containing protein